MKITILTFLAILLIPSLLSANETAQFNITCTLFPSDASYRVYTYFDKYTEEYETRAGIYFRGMPAGNDYICDKAVRDEKTIKLHCEHPDMDLANDLVFTANYKTAVFVIQEKSYGSNGAVAVTEYKPCKEAN